MSGFKVFKDFEGVFKKPQTQFFVFMPLEYGCNIFVTNTPIETYFNAYNIA